METTHDTRGKRITDAVFAIIGVFVIAVAFAIPLVGGAFSNGNRALGDFGAFPAPTASSTPTATPSPTPTEEECDPKYVQVASKNENGRVISDFEARYNASVAESNNLTDAQRTILIEESAKDATVLASWAHAFGLYSTPNARADLVEDGCLSTKGIILHSKLEGALTAKGVKFEEAEAPADWYNSGVHEGIYGVSEVSGIYGDRKAIKVTFKDGTVVYIMIRCGNPVYPGKPSLPDVPTDNPPPPEEEHPDDSKRPGEDPSQTGNLPPQQQPNQLPARQDHFQPTQPSNPPQQYTPPPAAPPPAPAPVPNPGGGDPIPAPSPEPTPVITPPVEAPPGPPPSTCAPAPGETTC